MEYWNGVTGMDSLEWRILDRVSSRNFILQSHGSRGRKAIIMAYSWVSFFWGGGGGGGGGGGLGG